MSNAVKYKILIKDPNLFFFFFFGGGGASFAPNFY